MAAAEREGQKEEEEEEQERRRAPAHERLRARCEHVDGALRRAVGEVALLLRHGPQLHLQRLPPHLPTRGGPSRSVPRAGQAHGRRGSRRCGVGASSGASVDLRVASFSCTSSASRRTASCTFCPRSFDCSFTSSASRRT